MTDGSGDLRRLWTALEVVHGGVYFAPESSQVYEQLGCRGWFMGYFASRAGALGEVGPAAVAALFHGFAPALVARALPDAWRMSSRAAVLGARADLAERVLRRAWPDVDPAAVDEAQSLTAALGEAAPTYGRALAAAHAALPRPADPVRALWYDATVLREFRGDGHVHALVEAGLDGAEANVLQQGLDLVPERQQRVRGWSDEQWASAGDRLRARGWLDAEGVATAEGRAARERVEEHTDRLAAPATDRVPQATLVRLTDLLLGPTGLATALVRTAAVPFPNPVGQRSPV